LAAYRLSKKYNIIHIIAPCGMLYEEAMVKNTFIKKIVWHANQRSIIKSSDCIHAKSNEESARISNMFPKHLINVIPNPIKKQKSKVKRTKVAWIDRIAQEKNVLLYLGRISRRKGLMDLLKIWERLVKHFNNWVVLISGSIDEKDKKFYQEMVAWLDNCEHIKYQNLEDIKSNIIDSNLIFTGPVYDIEKNIIFKRSSIFINPSNFENFGQSIAEALSFSLPVIVSKKTPWKDIEIHKCGWLLDENNSNLKSILEGAMSYTSSDLKRMGLNSQKLLLEFEQGYVTKKTLSLYSKLYDKKFR